MNDADRAAPRVLLLIPSRIDPKTKELISQGMRPRADYYALQERLAADILDYSALETGALPCKWLVRLVGLVSRNAALAVLGYVRRADYDIMFTNGENVGIPLAFLIRACAVFRRTGTYHVMIGHRLSSRKKRLLLRIVRKQIHTVFVYSLLQRDYARNVLGFEASQLIHIPFHADHEFFRPYSRAVDNSPRLISSAGMEWRDYSTLFRAVDGLDVEVRVGAYSPWSRNKIVPNYREAPPNVAVQRYNYVELRELYGESRCVVVPVLQTDFQAGITTIIEAMSMGKPVIASLTAGMAETIQDGVNGVLVPPGDALAMRTAISELLENPSEAARLGKQARLDVEASLTLDHWVERISHGILSVWSKRICSANSGCAAAERMS